VNSDLNRVEEAPAILRMALPLAAKVLVVGAQARATTSRHHETNAVANAGASVMAKFRPLVP
jgi:hypothetical protein